MTIVCEWRTLFSPPRTVKLNKFRQDTRKLFETCLDEPRSIVTHVYWITSIEFVIRFTYYPPTQNYFFVNIEFLRLSLKNKCRKELFVSFPNTRYAIQKKYVPVDRRNWVCVPTATSTRPSIVCYQQISLSLHCHQISHDANLISLTFNQTFAPRTSIISQQMILFILLYCCHNCPSSISFEHNRFRRVMW